MNSKKLLINMKPLLIIGIVLIFFGCAMTKEFKETAARLNTPQLIDEYQRQNFSYATTGEGYGCGGVDISYSTKGCSPGYIFSSKKGNCAAYTTFAVYCLRQAGYEAYPIRIHSQWPSWLFPNFHPRDFHYVALYKQNGKWYIMDNGRGRGPQGISGPFDSVNGLPYRVLNIEK